MKKISLAAVATALFAAGLAVAVAPAGAASGGNTPYIVGGTKAPETRWAVQLVFEQDGGTYGCTGEQITSRWVLTANHCVDGTTAMNVYHSNDTSDLGKPVKADKLKSAPNGDFALVHLSKNFGLSSYPKLNLTYKTRKTGTGTIEGYGLRANAEESDGLYRATVNLVGASKDAYNGTAQHIKGKTGASNHGDSGGPLIVDGKIVGVCSTGDSADPGANIHAGSNYAVLAQSAKWLRTTAGL